MSSLSTDPHDGATRVTAPPPGTVVILMAQTSLATWWRRAQDRVVVASAQKLRIGQPLHEAVEPIANEATAPYIWAELLPPELLHLATFCGTQAFARLHPHLDFKPFPGDVARAYSQHVLQDGRVTPEEPPSPMAPLTPRPPPIYSIGIYFQTKIYDFLFPFSFSFLDICFLA